MRKDSPLAPFFSHHFLILEEIWLIGEGVTTLLSADLRDGYKGYCLRQKKKEPTNKGKEESRKDDLKRKKATERKSGATSAIVASKVQRRACRFDSLRNLPLAGNYSASPPSPFHTAAQCTLCFCHVSQSLSFLWEKKKKLKSALCLIIVAG